MKIRLLSVIAITVGATLVPSTAIAQVPGQDSVTAEVPITAQGLFQDIQINAQSGPSGENPAGTAFFSVGVRLGGSVTCLSVNGKTATLNATDGVGVFTIEVIDNAGTGVPDTFNASPENRAPADCSPLPFTSLRTDVTAGDITVVDAPAVPTTKDQCKNGGWRNYPDFKNQGQCLVSVFTARV